MTGVAAVFLDRDGVLNESQVKDGVPVPPRKVRDFRLLPGVSEACWAFAHAGLTLVVVTNQPDLSRGSLRQQDLDEMHRVLTEALPIDDVVVCPHDDDAGCPCRKPRPGMILDAARRHGINLDRSVCVGDRWRDVEAARRAGVASIHIDWSHGEQLRGAPDAVFDSLLAAQQHVLDITGYPNNNTPPTIQGLEP